MSISLRELIEKHAGGVRGGWDNLLAVIPGMFFLLLPVLLALNMAFVCPIVVHMKSVLNVISGGRRQPPGCHLGYVLFGALLYLWTLVWRSCFGLLFR